MKKPIFFSILFSLMFLTSSFGQEKPVTFTVSLSTDSILMDNYFEVKFTVENADGKNFEAPDFSENFEVVSGPNFSSSVSMLNGEVTQSMYITYYLRPKDIGAYYILPASVQANGQILETAPLEVFVHPNPDGIQQDPPMNNGDFHIQFADPFGQGSPFEELFKGFDGQAMPFGFDELFKGFDEQVSPENFNEMLKQFNMDMSQEEMDEMLKQLQEQMQQFDFSFPPPPSDDQQTIPQKKRKTTRI
ncbi:MAG: BatD family protein [Saprospiraceae bacterium]